MEEVVLGKMLRQFTKIGFIDLGRVVWVSPERDAFWIAAVAQRSRRSCEKKHRHKEDQKRTRTFDTELKSPQRWDASRLGAQFALVDFIEPPHWLISERELDSGVVATGLVSKRAKKVHKWKEVRDKRWGWIEPIITEYGCYELLECGLLPELVRKRAAELGIGTRALNQTIRLFLLGTDRNSLLPAYHASGGRNSPRFSEKKVGRKRDDVVDGKSTDLGFICTSKDRDRLVAGWRCHKRGEISEYQAYLLTCHDYWPGREPHKSGLGILMLAKATARPTLAQFRRAAAQEGLRARRERMGERAARENCRPLQGSMRDGVLSFGQLAEIDSTSEDQTPVSQICSLDILPSTYRTVVIEQRTQYILGVHSGFEHPSTQTSLMALLNAATDKVKFCERYDVRIGEGDWIAFMPKRVRGDNGEVKSAKGISEVNHTEASLEFARSYGSSSKGNVESNHGSLHKQVDHTHAGSTKGRLRKRGERAPEKDACRTHHENMGSVILTILRHNNEVPVPHLLTLEMRQDGVVPTRRAIMEWCFKKGYVASEPINLNRLHVQCLPRLKAKIHRDGVHVFDPRPSKATRCIPQFLFSSTWLMNSGLCEKHRAGMEIEVHLDPNNLLECHLFRDGAMQTLTRKGADHSAKELTFCEHLLMTDDDKSQARSMSGDLAEGDARRAFVREHVEKQARKRKAAAQSQAQEGDPPKKRRSNKRDNATKEKALAVMKSLGMNVGQAIAEVQAAPPPLVSNGETVADSTVIAVHNAAFDGIANAALKAMNTKQASCVKISP